MFGHSMKPGEIYIDVWNCRVVVSRYARVQGGITSEPAQNWQELEDAASAEIESQGGAFTLSGHYVCSDALAARARFHTEQ